MKRLISILICVAMMFSLCACDLVDDIADMTENVQAVPKTFEYNDFTIELTSDFLTMDFVDDEYDFIWGTTQITIMGLLAEMEPDVLENITAFDYATAYREEIKKANIEPSKIEDLDGIPVMKYTTDSAMGELSVMTAFYKGSQGVWVVLYNVRTDIYDENYKAICQYAKSVKCN